MDDVLKFDISKRTELNDAFVIASSAYYCTMWSQQTTQFTIVAFIPVQLPVGEWKASSVALSAVNKSAADGSQISTIAKEN